MIKFTLRIDKQKTIMDDRYERTTVTDSSLFLPVILTMVIVFLTLPFSGCTMLGSNDGTSYALIYGVTYDYLSSNNRLQYTDDDAIAVAELLESKGYTVTVRAEGATGDGVLPTFDTFKSDIIELSQIIGPRDTFLFYFSGHGGRSSDFLLYNIQGQEPDYADSLDEWLLFHGVFAGGDWTLESLQENGANEETLLELLSKLGTDRKMIIIDACNSGGFINNTTDADRIPPSINKAELGITDREHILLRAASLYFDTVDTSTDISYADAVILSASGEQEYSLELSSIEHGLFTYYLLETPKNGDLNGDGLISITEAYAYTAACIEEDWNSNSDVPSDWQYAPHITGGPVDFLLFEAD